MLGSGSEAQPMHEIIPWLRRVENLAAGLYTEASHRFAEDRRFAAFLGELAADERRHVQLMERAAELLRHSPDALEVGITLDPETVSAAEEPILATQAKLAAGTLSSAEMARSALAIESSELNDLFLYVIDALKKNGAEFQREAARLQAHVGEVEEFLGSLPDGSHLLAAALSSVWRKRILIVDDEPMMVRFLSTICRKEGSIETAKNGSQALEKLGGGYFDLIISDIDMPMVNGIELYEQAAEADPSIGQRFLFISGKVTAERARYLRENQLTCLHKPVALRELKHAIRRVLSGDTDCRRE
jgi:CheY-like chemotaxis protein